MRHTQQIDVFYTMIYKNAMWLIKSKLFPYKIAIGFIFSYIYSYIGCGHIFFCKLTAVSDLIWQSFSIHLSYSI